jgi:hypothetical protein
MDPEMIRAIRRGVRDYIKRSRPYHIAIVTIPCLIAIPLIGIVIWRIATGNLDLKVLAPGGIVIFVVGFAIDYLCKINNCIGQASFLEGKLRAALSKEQCFEVIDSLSCTNLKASLIHAAQQEAKHE